ncbi:hypothetical protein ERX46_13970 [Brumimicrobium glaciale]|uniref:Uncharacterized protein n=1 Tax=Brumimicrobium glaciale TaxID=200475 RepID=A0A4Q4KH00_9FLAO|nr:hypothetical protein [Brumimicrobium glaciale]RYM32385.1 hypothetical protein ERX46_13970 [Brumimicrobium glaciale]
MKNKLNKGLHYLLLVVLMASALYVFVYYMLADEILDLRTLPTGFLIAVIVYILAQLIKRFLQKKMPWYNWLYYLGLIAVIVPLPLFSVQGNWVFSVTRWGSLFLLIPPLIEFLILVKSKPSVIR